MHVLLADSFRVYRKGMAAVLSRTPGVTTLVEAQDAAEAVQAAQRLHPQLLIMAADLAGGALVAAQQILDSYPDVRLILLVDRPEDAQWYQSRGLRAEAYLPRNASIAQLLQVIGLVPLQQ